MAAKTSLHLIRSVQVLRKVEYWLEQVNDQGQDRESVRSVAWRSYYQP